MSISITAAFEDELNSLTTQLTNEKFNEAEQDLRAKMKPHQENYEKGTTELKQSMKVLKNNNATDRVQEEEAKLG